MTCDQNSQSVNTDFSLLDKGVVINLLLKAVEDCLLDLKTNMDKLWPELTTHSGTIVERFYNGEFSSQYQTTVNKSPMSGKVTFHDENTRPENLLKREKKKGLGRQIDIGIRLNHTRDRILVIEGKRLHSKNDKQYVSGDTGGISRFKRSQHGEELEKACMVGFVETDTYTLWHEAINGWIASEQSKTSDLLWGENELLQPLTTYDDRFSKCHSTHARIAQMPIELVHYWVDVM